MAKTEAKGLISILEREHGEQKKLWFVSRRDGLLIVIPELARKDFDSLLGKRKNTTGLDIIKLDRPPEPSELKNFEGIIALESNSGTGDPLKTRAVWTTQHGPTALGGIFPSQQPHLKNFETLTGVLFPRNVEYDGSVNQEIIEPWINALSANITVILTKVLGQKEQQQSLDNLLHLDRSRKKSLAIYGLGDIGSFVAQTIYAQNIATSYIDELILASKSRKTVEALKIELEDIGLRRDQHPELKSVTQDNIADIFGADIILFLASGPIPIASSDSMNIDVRAVQYAANAKILEELLKNAAEANWKGTLLVASDPVEQLTMAALKSSITYNRNNQRIAGFGAAINFGRARRQAENMGLSPEGVRIFGAHGKSVVAIPTLSANFDIEAAEKLSLHTGMRNYKVREQSKKPWRAPAAWMVSALQNLLLHQMTWASTFLPGNNPDDMGAFFGSQAVGDIGLHLWEVGTNDKPADELLNVLEREHQYISSTSLRPELLATDPFKGSSDPLNCHHLAFHKSVFQGWKKEAEENAVLINTSDIALSTRSQEITMKIERAIMEKNLTAENIAKQELLKLIESSLHRSEENMVEEKINIISEGALGGELFSNITYRRLSEVCEKIVDRIDIENLSNRTLSILKERREPEVDIINRSEVKTTTLLEGLKHPHIIKRSQTWIKLAKLLEGGFNFSPALAKKILTLINFGDDFTLYQISASEINNIESIKSLYESQRKVLSIIGKKMKGYKGPEISDAVVFGTTGAPFGQHHINAVKAGIQSIRERYDESDTEAFIALDDFSRSKADAIVSGEIPPLTLRRRIALLQTINETQIHLVNPAIPIWFDVQNVKLLGQIRKEVTGEAKIWRLIGGDSLKNYPNSALYQSIPHIIAVRGESRSLIDHLLNRMKFEEYLQLDLNNTQSSSQIRRDLKDGMRSGEINSLTEAFIRHYGLFQ